MKSLDKKKNGKSAKNGWDWKKFWRGEEEEEREEEKRTEKELPMVDDRQVELEKAFSYVECEVGNINSLVKSMQESTMEYNKSIVEAMAAVKDEILTNSRILGDHEETLNEHEERITALEKKVRLVSAVKPASAPKTEPAPVKLEPASAFKSESASGDDPGKVLASVSKRIAGEEPESASVAPAPKPEPTPTVKPEPASVAPTVKLEPASVAPTVKPEPALKAEPIPRGFTGKGLIFLIHDKEGTLNTSMVFESPLVAKWFDPNYEVAPAWFEGGKFIRVLTAEEAVNIR